MNEQTENATATPEAVTGGKKPYEKPVLVSYGQLKHLTQSGSKDGKENTGAKKDQRP